MSEIVMALCGLRSRKTVLLIVPVVLALLIIPEVSFGQVVYTNDNAGPSSSDTRPCWAFEFSGDGQYGSGIAYCIVKSNKSTYTVCSYTGTGVGSIQYIGAYLGRGVEQCAAYQKNYCQEGSAAWWTCEILLTKGSIIRPDYWQQTNRTFSCADIINWCAEKNPRGTKNYVKDAEGNNIAVDGNGKALTDKYGNPLGTDPTTLPATDGAAGAVNNAANQAHQDANQAHQDAQDIKDALKAASQPAQEIADELKRQYDPTTHPAEMPKNVPQTDTTKLNYITLLRNLTQGQESFTWTIDWDIQNPITGTIYRNIHFQVYPLQGEIAPILEVRLVFRAFMNVLYTILLGSAIYRLLRQV